MNATVVSEGTETVSVNQARYNRILENMLIGVVAGGMASRAADLGHLETIALSGALLVLTLIALEILRRFSDWIEPSTDDDEDRPYEDAEYAS